MKQRELPLRRHLEELRKRLIISGLATMITTVAAFIFYKQIINLLLIPAGDLGEEGAKAELVFIEVTEMVAVTMKVSLVSGLVLAFPVILYEIVMFVAPGLAPREKRYLLTFMPAVVLAFVAGIAFGYFVLIPPAISFLLSWGGDIATPTIRIGNYVNVVLMLLFWLGVVFETPVVMFLLAKLGVVSWRGFAHWRKHWVVVAFILGALITPTFDPVNQSLVAVPLLLLYEVGIQVSRLATRGRVDAYREVAARGTQGR